MGKVVTTVLVVAVAVAIVVFAPQIAAAIGASGIFGATVTAATLATITSSLVGLGVSLGMAAAASVLRKAPSMSQSLVDRLHTSVVPSAPRKIVFGTTAAGADVRFAETFDRAGSKKDGYAQIIALASHRINAVKEWYLEETRTWANGAIVDSHDGGVLAVQTCLEGKPGNGFSWGSGKYWTPQSTFTGCAYLATRYKLDSKVWPSGIPSRYTTIVEGCPLYDPRRDSENGGSGSHRIEDQATWTFREGTVEIGRNPALALLTYLLGYRIAGKLVWGMGIPAHRIDFDNFRAYANLCEERVLTQSGATVQRYTADGTFSTGDPHETVINGLSAAMGSCKLVDTSGVYQLVGGYDDTLGPKVDFDENDLVAAAGSASPYLWKPAPPTRELHNIVRGRFADPSSLYQLVDWGVVETDPLPDAIPRTLSLDLGLVTRAETCQRIAKQWLLREAKTPGVFSATFGPKAFRVQVGSLITMSLPERGWNRKLFRVIEQVETHDLLFTMALREESSEVYAWDREEKPLPATIRPDGYNPRDTIAPENLTVSSSVVEGAGGQQVSEVEVTWLPAPSARVVGIQIESRPTGAIAWTEQAAIHDPVSGIFRFTSNVAGIDLAVRARYRMDTGVYSEWVDTSVKSAAVEIVDGKARDDAATAINDAEAATENANSVRRNLPQLVRPILQDPIERLSALHIQGAAVQAKATVALHERNLIAIQSLSTRIEDDGALVAEQVTQLTTRVENSEDRIESGFLEINRTIADADEALAASITAQIANFGEDINASINEERIARATAVDAVARDLDEMSGRVSTLSEDLSGEILDSRQLTIDKDGAMAERVDALGVRIDDEVAGRSAAIRTVEEAVANETDARASAIQTIESTYGDRIAAVEIEASTATDALDNLNAQYTVKVQSTLADGTTVFGGFGVANQNGVVDTAFMTDAFRIYTPGVAPRQVFYADGDGVKMTNVEVDKLKAGTIDFEFINRQSLQNASGGYQVLPGGLIIMWGQVRMAINDEQIIPVTFPTPFTTALMSLTATPYIATANNYRDLWIQTTATRSLTGASFYCQAATGNQQRLDGFDWMAFGY